MQETENSSSLLTLKDYDLSLNSEKGPVQVLNQVNITLNAQETVGLVGESGCGKSMTALSMMGLLSNKIIAENRGALLWRGENLSNAGNQRWRELRGRKRVRAVEGGSKRWYCLHVSRRVRIWVAKAKNVPELMCRGRLEVKTLPAGEEDALVKDDWEDTEEEGEHDCGG